MRCNKNNSSRDEIYENNSKIVKAVKMPWAVTTCGLAGRYQHLRGMYCLPREGEVELIFLPSTPRSSCTYTKLYLLFRVCC
jgi:hypothetical protein